MRIQEGLNAVNSCGESTAKADVHDKTHSLLGVLKAEMNSNSNRNSPLETGTLGHKSSVPKIPLYLLEPYQR